ncbi:PEP-CTERM sorting domain-containing protein [Algisphaera agarilytica]|uniref:MYXO-CTERM domain-containing protein n=1 Tax=Algisphaera agarilytica TaxID=1385975 RepID=A0A7X0H5J9_9BACT|nr:PEP-CTERM sorting domain-containing protein [Algisphaera agarilytica]MBB6429686.1 MYXO-CTERM domain-containing protein [Algisphaera agarilytica]
MSRNLKFSTMALLAAVASPAFGQTTIGSDTFDGGAGEIYTSRVFTPDNSANNGNFGGSIFDNFGIIDPTGGGVPFDFLDDSTTFIADRFGIFQSGDRDRFVGMQDTVNGSNPGGTVQIDWTFDISGYENIQVSVDMAAVGDFEGDDTFDFFAQIDGGSLQNPITATAQSGTFYDVTVENGSTYESYATPFFDDVEWDDLIANGPGVSTTGDTVDFHPLDNGLDGDTTAMDGFIPEELLSSTTNEERAYNVTNSFGNFDQIEFEAFKDPVVVTTASGTTQLDNTLQTITADISGTGDTLTLSFFASSNSSPEVFAFDDLLITGDLIDTGTILAGDYNGNGVVDAADYTVWQDSFGDTVVAGTGADGNENGVIDAADYTVWQDNFGNTASGSGATVIPEPSAGLILAGLGALAARRRRKA